MMKIKLLYIDLFCGAGGTSTGVGNARRNGEQCAKVIACVNHDANAIASHAANHPDALHFTEDIRTLELSPLVEHVLKMRALYPDAFIVLWASLECTNFSKAKGGQPRDADSRTLAEHLFRYIEVLKPDYIQIENVEEFMSWGPMDENGKPLSMQRGKDYTKWVRNVKSYGHDFDHRIMNSADYGAYTSRKRFFGIFARKGLPIVWPEPTHCKEGKQDMFSNLKKWKAVKDVLDFEDEGESIFGRKKPLVDATLERICSGLVKFVAGGKDAFMVKWNSMSQSGKYQAPDNADFLSAYYSNGDNVSSANSPCPTVPTKDRFNFVRPKFLSMYYGDDNHASSIDKPAPTIRTNEDPSQVITANRKWHYIVNPQYSSAGGSVNNPCFTLIARMDKMPPYLTECTTEAKDIPSFIHIDGNVAIYEIYDTDTPAVVKIKEFMALYGIVDIKIRMLRIPELKQIMGFPKDYKLIGSQADQKKFIGNAVEVNMARVLCEALSAKLIELNIKPLRIAE